MNQKLSNIKKKILNFVQEGEKVDRVLDICISNLEEYEKKELKKMFEDDMRKHRKEAEATWASDLTYPLSEILRSRLFVYPEPDNSSEQLLFIEKGKSGNYTDDEITKVFGDFKTPLSIKMEEWEAKETNGGMFAWIYDGVEKRNKRIYDLADKVANGKQSNIELGIYINELDKHIEKYTSELDLLAMMHLRYSIPQKNVLVWDTLTSAENDTGTQSRTFGRYKLSCKLQWEILNRTPEPEVGYVQISELTDPTNLESDYEPIFVEVFTDVYYLDKNLDLLYNKIHDIRET